jgi:hypothetical protein
LFAYWLGFEPSVESHVSFEVRPPAKAADGEVLAIRKSLVKTFPLGMNCPTKSVEYILEQVPNGHGNIDLGAWPLQKFHGGLQRGEGRQEYRFRFVWPQSAAPGKYRVRNTVRYQCNPVAENINSYVTESFEVR